MSPQCTKPTQKGLDKFHQLNDSGKSGRQLSHAAAYKAWDRISPSSKGSSVISTQQTADGGLSLSVCYYAPL